MGSQNQIGLFRGHPSRSVVKSEGVKTACPMHRSGFVLARHASRAQSRKWGDVRARGKQFLSGADIKGVTGAWRIKSDNVALSKVHVFRLNNGGVGDSVFPKPILK